MSDLKRLDKIQRKYYFQEYDPAWILKFEKVKLLLQKVFKSKAVRIEHVGLTSIVGMKAKPVIDVLISVKSVSGLEKEISEMVRVGYEWRKDYISKNTHLLAKTNQDTTRIENIHICEVDSISEGEFLKVKEYLLFNSERAKEYSDLKERNFNLYKDNYPKYREGKWKFLEALKKEAFAWFDKK